eukprot:3083829-Rhodomonas_salina.1
MMSERVVEEVDTRLAQAMLHRLAQKSLSKSYTERGVPASQPTKAREIPWVGFSIARSCYKLAGVEGYGAVLTVDDL